MSLHSPSAVVTSTTRSRWAWPLSLAGLGVAVAAVTLIGLNAGARSEYYAAIAKSMSLSWSNFFFGSFDPAGTVTLDKIPGSYWVPALFARVFGFSTWSIEAPNALAAVATALIAAVTVRRLAGDWAGLLAGLIVGTTPILVAVSRSNQPETFFVLALTAAVWAALHALSTHALRWLIGAGAFIGLAFQCYMLEAWALWPALIIGYLCTAQPWLRKLWHLAVAGSVSLAISLAWIALVDAIPASNRPYIGSTIHNSAWEMVFGYNGLGRFGATSSSADYNSFTPPFSGNAGVLRLLNEQVAGQIAWLLPAALVAVVVLAVLRFGRPVTVFLGASLVVYVVMFSAVAGMHQFYVAALAPFIAIPIAVAFAVARTRALLWPQIALLAVAAVSAIGVSLQSAGYLSWLPFVQAVLAMLAGGFLVAEARGRFSMAWAVNATVIAALVLTPLGWSVGTIGNSNGLNPVAGPAATSGMGGGMGFPGGPGSNGPRGMRGPTGQGGPGGMSGQGGPGALGGNAQRGPGGAGGPGAMDVTADSSLIAFLQSQNEGERYLLATFGAQAAAPYITAAGMSVLPIGGFSGSDNVPTLDEFIALVSTGQLRYVLIDGGHSDHGGPGNGPGAGGPQLGSNANSGSASAIRSWVDDHCTAVTDGAVSTGTLVECAAG